MLGECGGRARRCGAHLALGNYNALVDHLHGEVVAVGLPSHQKDHAETTGAEEAVEVELIDTKAHALLKRQT